MKTLSELDNTNKEYKSEFKKISIQIDKIVKKELGEEWSTYILSGYNTISIFKTIKNKGHNECCDNYERIIIKDKEYQTNFDDKDNFGKNIFNKIKHLL
jgi:hypothetical protein